MVRDDDSGICCRRHTYLNPIANFLNHAQIHEEIKYFSHSPPADRLPSVYLHDSSARPTYRPGLERWSAYKTLWIRHWEGFRAAYGRLFEKTYGPLTVGKIVEAEKLIRCGKFANGFRMHRCPGCGVVLAVPFTCKSRLCLSCCRKRLFGWSVNLSHIMNTGLSHFHVTLTLPGSLRQLLFQRDFTAHELVNTAACVLQKYFRKQACMAGDEWKSGMIAAAHACGSSLNYNPHVHIVATRELVNTVTGEITDPGYVPYTGVWKKWMKASLSMMVRKGYLSRGEAEEYALRHPGGFHVHFKPIRGNENDIHYKTAEYLAAGPFHNSRILSVDHGKKTITFRFRRMIDRRTKEKHYASMTLPVYEFMARMLYYLPEKHQKTIRYYGIYAHSIEKKLQLIRKKTWAYAIEHCFQKDPERCPQCGTTMRETIIYSYYADRIMKKLTHSHYLDKGYFIPSHGP